MAGNGVEISVEQYLELVAPAGDEAQLELIDGDLWYGQEPFYELCRRYLALRGEVPSSKQLRDRSW